MGDAWFYSLNGQQHGPIPLAELRRLVSTGQLNPLTEAWAQGAVAPITAGQAVAAPQPEDGLQFIVPTSNTSATALIAGYLGIFGFLICPLGPFALGLGIMGLNDLKKNPQKNGALRAWTGIVSGLIQIAACIFWLVATLWK